MRDTTVCEVFEKLSKNLEIRKTTKCKEDEKYKFILILQYSLQFQNEKSDLLICIGFF
jgi:hypothetical protein